MKNNNLLWQCLYLFVILFGINSPGQANNTDWMLVERFKSVQQQAQNGKVQAMYDVGRMYELGMMGTFKLGWLDLFSDVEKFPMMLRKGKLRLIPSLPGKRTNLKGIFRRTKTISK